MTLWTMQDVHLRPRTVSSRKPIGCVAWQELYVYSQIGQSRYYHSFSGPSECLARLQMELCRAANIFAARQNQMSAFWGFVEIFGL